MPEIRVAALYTLAKTSPYDDMPEVDCWPASRDALLYLGPWPVVAHPPCAPWSRAVRHQVNMSAEQGPHLAPAAVLQVRRWGGILEQPARSYLWRKMTLPYPSPPGQSEIGGPDNDAWGGFTIEVHQIDWGHVAIKRTWLYVVGIERDEVRLPEAAPPRPPSLDLRVSPSTGIRRYRTPFELGSAEGRKRTPPAFARWLVDLAATARPGSRRGPT